MAAAIFASLGHPDEVAALLRYKFATKKQIKIAADDRAKIRCYEFLDQTSRSFAAVIRDLDDELRDQVCIFYLVLRGLDTIEDDMTIPVEKKVILLRQFHQILRQKGWTFSESGPEEKDRQLLIEFDVVIDVFLQLERKFQDVIMDICKRMGHGMAEYVSNAKLHTYGVITNDDFDEYCHYVAGLVGHGLSNLFAASGLEDPSIAHESRLANSMGLFLQKVNIIRDYLDDVEKNRLFWPRQIWSQYVDELIDLKAPGNEGRALDCLTAMIVNALQHAPDCLSYIHRLRNRSVIAFCAIPQVMAIATLAVLFRNYHVFEGVVKIRRGEAVLLIERCKSMREVADIFRQYTRQIICKNVAKDPNFMKISIACGQIEQWCQTNLPSLDSQTDLPNNTSFNMYFLLVFLLAPLAALYISSKSMAELKQQG